MIKSALGAVVYYDAVAGPGAAASGCTTKQRPSESHGAPRNVRTRTEKSLLRST